MPSNTLILNVKREYFKLIKDGTKKEEYRKVNNFWMQRIAIKKDFLQRIEIRCGYPKPTDTKRILVFPWKGYTVKNIIHDHFGPDSIRVYAIKLEHDTKEM